VLAPLGGLTGNETADSATGHLDAGFLDTSTGNETSAGDDGNSDSTPGAPEGGPADASLPEAEASVDAPFREPGDALSDVAEESSPVAPIAFVQIAAASPSGTATSVSAKFAQAQAAGDLNVVAVGWFDATSVVSTVTDSSGSAYSLAIGPTRLGSDLSQSIYYAPNIVAAAAGTNSITVTFVEAANVVDLRILEYSGLDTSSPLDETASGSGNSSGPATTAAVTTKTARELLFAAGMTSEMYSNPGTSFVSRLVSSDGDIVEDRIVSATGSYTGNASVNESCEWLVQMATFK
jgi:hypothetical protein